MTVIQARPPYTRRPVPAAYDRGWFGVELAAIQRAIVGFPSRTVTASTSLTVEDFVVLADPTSAAITLTALDPSRCAGLLLALKQITSAAHTVTVGGTVDGSANPTLGGINKCLVIYSDGVAWRKLASL